MEIKNLSTDQDFQSVINNINDYLKKINDYQANHQSEFGLPIEELGQFRKSWFYNNWQARFRKIQAFNGLGLTGVINNPNTTFEEWLWYFHEWSESFMDDYNKFKELIFQVLMVIEKHLEAVDTELQDHENRITDNTNRLDNVDVKQNQYEQQLEELKPDQLYTKSEGEALEQSISNQLATVDTKLQSSIKHLEDIPALVSSNLVAGEVVKVLNNYNSDGIAQTFSIKASKPSSGLWFQLINGNYACEVQGYRDFIPKIMSQPFMTLANNDLMTAKTILDKFAKRGYDGFVLDVHMEWNEQTGFSTREDLTVLRQAFEYSQSKGFTTTAIKIHYTGTFTTNIVSAYSGYITTVILPALASLNVDKVVVLNERKETVDKYHADLIPQFKQLVQNIQNMGYQVGISYENDVALSGAVANNFDLMSLLNFIGCNLYPTIGAYGRGITASDVKEAFDESVGNIAPALQLGKPFYVTETGIRPYNHYFGSPSNYGYDDSTNPDFTVFTRYFEGVFNSGIKSVAVEVWDWHAWDNDIPEMTRLIKGKRGVI